MTLSGCKRQPDSAQSSIAWTDSEPTCDFRRVQAHADSKELADSFIARSADGEFSRAENWLPTAVDCPGHEPGYDLFEVVSTYAVKPLNAGADTVRYELTLNRVGVMSNGFHAEPGITIDTFVTYRTPYGWRIVSPAPWSWITASAAISRKWLSAEDTLHQAR